MGEVILGRYEIVKKLGEGGMGVTFLAYDRFIGTPFAVKTLLGKQKDYSDFLDKEIAVSLKLDHPNVCKSYESGTWNGQPVFVMEYLGESYDGYHLSLEDAVDVSIDVARGCGAIHDAGFLHRDIAPKNIYLANNAGVLADLGLVWPRDQSSATEDRRTIGTPWYMSPEQVTGEELDPRSDVYNLGMTMFELRFGWKLMQGGSAEEVMQNHKDGKYTLPLFKDIQEDHYVRIVAESISLRPEDRYQSMDSLIAALEELQKSIRLSKQSKFPRLESIKQAVTSWWESHMNQKLISMTTTDMPCLG